MAYVVIKTVRGRRYRYLQRSWREGKRVRTESKYLGPANHFVTGSRRKSTKRRRRSQIQGYEARNMATLSREAADFDEWQRNTYGETGQERAERERSEHLQQLHDEFGLVMPSSVGSSD